MFNIPNSAPLPQNSALFPMTQNNVKINKYKHFIEIFKILLKTKLKHKADTLIIIIL